MNVFPRLGSSPIVKQQGVKLQILKIAFLFTETMPWLHLHGTYELFSYVVNTPFQSSVLRAQSKIDSR